MSHETKVGLFIFFALTVAVLFLGTMSNDLAAITTVFGGKTYFGGQIEEITNCGCNILTGEVSKMIEVGPPRGGTFIKKEGDTRVYEYYFFRDGEWVLGSASGWDVCVKLSVGITGVSCKVAGQGPVIEKIGISF